MTYHRVCNQINTTVQINVYIWRQCTYIVYVGSVRVITHWKTTWLKKEKKKEKQLFALKTLLEINLYIIYCQFLWTLHYLLPLRYSLTFIMHTVSFQRWNNCVVASRRFSLCWKTWNDLFVLSQHERDNRIHNIFSKSVM
jgi:hypothetical protein